MFLSGQRQEVRNLHIAGNARSGAINIINYAYDGIEVSVGGGNMITFIKCHKASVVEGNMIMFYILIVKSFGFTPP